ncbi:MAG: DUF47 family protein [Acidobacteriota bacterium]
MAFNLFPRVVRFYDMLQAQSRFLTEAARALECICEDPAGRNALCKRIGQLAQEGDALEREISTKLAQTFITPLDREDIHDLNLAQEDLLNLIHAVSTRLGIYPFSTMRPGVRTLAGELRRMVDEIAAMVGNLGKKKLDTHSTAAREIKSDASALILVALGELYEQPVGSAGEVMEIMLWAQIYDRMEQAVRQAQALASLLERIGVKNA